MASFTSWSDLHKSMLDDLASGNWRTKSYDFDGMRKEFFAPDEFLRMLSFVQDKAAGESEGCALRTSLRAGDR